MDESSLHIETGPFAALVTDALETRLRRREQARAAALETGRLPLDLPLPRVSPEEAASVRERWMRAEAEDFTPGQDLPVWKATAFLSASPGPGLAAAIERVSAVTDPTPVQRELLITATARQISHLHALQLSAVAGILEDATERHPDPTCSSSDWAYRQTEAVVAAALKLPSARGTVDFAARLAESFPATLAALSEGAITRAQATVIVDELTYGNLTDEDRAGLERRALAHAPGCSTRQTLRHTRKIVTQADPTAADRRHQDRLATAGTFLKEHGDGIAAMNTTGSAPKIRAAYGALDALARAARSEGDPRTLAQIRTDIVADLLCGKDHLDTDDLLLDDLLEEEQDDDHDDADLEDSRKDGQEDGPAASEPDHAAAPDPAGADLEGPTAASSATTSGSAASGPATSGPGSQSEGPATSPAAVNPDVTATPGKADQSGSCGCGSGVFGQVQLIVHVHQDILRRLADGKLQTTGQLGHLDGFGWLAPSQTAVLMKAARHMAVAATDDDGRILFVTPTQAYQPPDSHIRLTRAAHQYCRFPGCRRPAEEGDIDHVVNHPAGPTHPDNEQPLCRKHHNMKTHGGWTLRPADPNDPTGDKIWTTPAGTDHLDRLEEPLFAPPPPPTPPPPPRRGYGGDTDDPPF